MFKRFAKKDPRPPKANQMLAGLLARHFDDAIVQEEILILEGGRIIVDCEVALPAQIGYLFQVPLYFRVLGEGSAAAVRCSVSGYGPTVETAIQEGARMWAGTLEALINSANGNPPTSVEVTDESLLIGGRPYRLLSARMNRAMQTSQSKEFPSPDLINRTNRQVVGSTSMAAKLLTNSEHVPRLAWPTMSIITSTVTHAGSDNPKVQISVNGTAQRQYEDHFKAIAETGGHIVILQELAIVMPMIDAAGIAEGLPFERANLQQRLNRLSMYTETGNVAGWNGWRVHRGQLGTCLEPHEIDGRIPSEYGSFLATVAGPGAGPGFGLVYPQVSINRVVLAHAGCGHYWYLSLEPHNFGEVWIDATAAANYVTKVAPDFVSWYAEWLTACETSSLPWVPWEPAVCAGVGLAAEIREHRAERQDDPIVSLMFADKHGNPLDACQACTDAVGSIDHELGIPKGPLTFAL
jgi:hypothetical protein